MCSKTMRPLSAGRSHLPASVACGMTFGTSCATMTLYGIETPARASANVKVQGVDGGNSILTPGNCVMLDDEHRGAFQSNVAASRGASGTQQTGCIQYSCPCRSVFGM